MSDEMKVQTKGLNKKFIFIAIAVIAVGLVAALVLLLPTSAKAKKVEEQLNLGAKYLSELNYEQAIVAYEAVIKIDPKCEEAYLALADIYIATGAFDKAEEILKRAEEEIGDDVTDAISDKKKEVEDVKAEQKELEGPTSTPIPSPTVTTSLTPTNTPTPAAHTIYDGKIVELSEAKVGDVVLFGSYEQDNIDSNGAEAIPWYVLDKDGDKLLLMSVYLLDAVPYHEEFTEITWEDCTLRQWMNDDFYNRAFTQSEKKHILTSYLENADNPEYGTEGGNDTEDKVFTLALAEAEQYFEIVYKNAWDWNSVSPELSASQVTAYAEAQGAWVSPYSATTGNGWWWLRSPGSYNASAAYVDNNGSVVVCGGTVDDSGDVYVYDNYIGILNSATRPALWLNLNPSVTNLTPTATPSPTPTSTPSPIPSPTGLPRATPVGWKEYDGTTVELSKAKVGDVVLFGSYEQDNIASNGAETIPWYVLDKYGDKLLLMSVYLLDAVPYHEAFTEITWEDCTLRQWMNDEFYNSAFTKSEKKYIQTSYLENADNSYYSTEGGNDTEDRVFALSLAEAEQCFGVAIKVEDYWISASPELSTAKGTAYAEAQGAMVSSNELTVGSGYWWLRSPGAGNYFAGVIDDFGHVYVGGRSVFGHYKDYTYFAVRPALWLNLNP